LSENNQLKAEISGNYSKEQYQQLLSENNQLKAEVSKLKEKKKQTQKIQ